MERDFRYLRDKYGDAGARDIFENICIRLFQYKFKDAYPVKVSQGDGGIDIFVGDLTKKIDVYQCKYFIDEIGDAQKSQIRESFKTAIESKEYKLKEWFLCIPCILTLKEQSWWSSWKSRQQSSHKIKIKLYDGSMLLNEIKKYDFYNTLFDNDIMNLLEEILKKFEEKKRYYIEEIYEIEDLSEDEYEECLFVKKLVDANIHDIDECIKDFFNAEIIKETIESKDNELDMKMYKNLQIKIQSIWNNQYRQFASERDGTQLLAKTYERIEDLDTTTLQAEDEITMIVKKGIVHQLADKCKVGWLKNYADKLTQN